MPLYFHGKSGSRYKIRKYRRNLRLGRQCNTSRENGLIGASNNTPDLAMETNTSLENFELGLVLCDEKDPISKETLWAMMILLWEKHQLPASAVRDIMAFVNLCVGGKLFPKCPNTIFGAESNIESLKYRYYCYCKCGFLGPFENTKLLDRESCISCGKNAKDLFDDGQFYLLFNIELQVARLISDMPEFFQQNQDPSSLELLSDVTDGKQYKTGYEPNFLALSLAIDGVPTNNSSKRQFLPILAYLIELPAHIRKRFPLLLGVWEGIKKPTAEIYLKPLMMDLQRLYYEESCVGGDKRFRLRVINFTGDAPIRAWVQNILQFNGRYGCGWCLIKGSNNENERTLRFDYIRKRDLQIRTHAMVLRDAKQAQETGTDVNGVKGQSVLNLLPGFDLVNSVTPEMMHAVVLGVLKTLLLEGFLNADYSDKQFYIRPKMKLMETRIQSICTPSNVAKPIRPLSDVKFWKAAEIELFFTLFAPYVFKGILPASYFNNLCCLLAAVHKLSKTKICRNDIYSASIEIDDFLRAVQRLYPSAFHRYNFHILQHLPAAVENFGPLSKHSAYFYESDLGRLKKLIKSYKHVPQQVCNKYNVKIAAEEVLVKAADYKLRPQDLQFLNATFGDIQNDQALCPLGSCKQQLADEVVAFLKAQNIDHSTCQLFNRCTYGKFTVYTEKHTKKFKFQNCYVYSCQMHFYVVKHIIRTGTDIVFVVHKFEIAKQKHPKFSPPGGQPVSLDYMFRVDRMDSSLVLVEAKAIIGRFVLLPVTDNGFKFPLIIVPFNSHLC